MSFASEDKGKIHSLKVELNKKFEMKDLGSAKKILVMEIHRKKRTNVIVSLLKFNMSESKKV